VKPESFEVISPGRVNLLGEHVDYNGGVVLPAAIDRVVKLHVTPHANPTVRLNALDLHQQVQFDLKSIQNKQDLNGEPLPVWALYPAGVAWKMAQTGIDVKGLNCDYHSMIPIGAGLSSSAAVEVGFAFIWSSLAGLTFDRMKNALLCQQAEIEYVGVNCGIMDQFACANGIQDHALWFDTRSLESKSFPLPQNTTIVIADSSLRRSLLTSPYNDRRQDCETAVRILQQNEPGIQSLRDVSINQLFEAQHSMPRKVFKRARHVVEEMDRVNQAVRFLELGDQIGFGKLLFQTHNSLRENFQVSLPELDILVQLASEIEGCYGARLTGAGFGGCTVNLIQTDKVSSFIERLTRTYREKTGLSAYVFATDIVDGVHLA
jgi:galactokinase